jgi:hypothetical protein
MFFSGANLPTHSTTQSSGATPQLSRSAAERRAGLNNSVSTPRATTLRLLKPDVESDERSSGVGTNVRSVAL